MVKFSKKLNFTSVKAVKESFYGAPLIRLTTSYCNIMTVQHFALHFLLAEMLRLQQLHRLGRHSMVHKQDSPEERHIPKFMLH